MVPACHRLYYNVKDFGAKSHLRTLRTFWKSEFDSLEASILEIVDATALCAVIDEEARATASEIKKRTYAQVKKALTYQKSQKLQLQNCKNMTYITSICIEVYSQIKWMM
jgi:hypothetical protein